MSLIAKSKGNIKFVDMCVKKKALNDIAVNRAYYSVFQLIKHYLISKNFDYEAFLDKIHQNRKELYSHRTISKALKECLEPQRGFIDLSPLVYVASLHKRRKKADYEDIRMDEDALDDSHTEALSIISLMEKLN